MAAPRVVHRLSTRLGVPSIKMGLTITPFSHWSKSQKDCIVVKTLNYIWIDAWAINIKTIKFSMFLCLKMSKSEWIVLIVKLINITWKKIPSKEEFSSFTIWYSFFTSYIYLFVGIIYLTLDSFKVILIIGLMPNYWPDANLHVKNYQKLKVRFIYG